MLHSNIRNTDNVVIIYHDADFDGECSAAILYKYYSQYTKNIKFIPMNYGYEFDIEWCRNKIVAQADFSFPMDTMFRIRGVAKEYQWIDHHDTSLNEYNEFRANNKVPEILGLRGLDNSRGACELVYSYFFGGEIPRAIKLLSMFDVSTDIQSPQMDKDVLPFQYGLKTYETSDPKGSIWRGFIDNVLSELIPEVISKGKSIVEFERNQSEKYINSFSEKVSLIHDGVVISDNVIAVNKGMTTPIFTSVVRGKCDYFVTYNYKLDTDYTVGIYSDGRNDCSKVAELFGGGGHLGAAGFRCHDLPLVLND